MLPITIITLVVIALLTVIIFGLTWLSYKACLKAFRIEVEQGIHDNTLVNDYKAKSNKWGLAGTICSWLALIMLLGVLATGIVYKMKGENFSLNGKTVLVIKSDSMSEFYDEKRAEKYNNDTSLQFRLGDICVFEEVSDKLKVGEVYGYKFKDIIITHRLIAVDEATGLCEFRGDYNYVSDAGTYGLIKTENVIYHYTGQKINGLGVFILYAQSYFGLWSLIGITIVLISSEVILHKITKVIKERCDYLIAKKQKEAEEEAKRRKAEEEKVAAEIASGKKVKSQFRRRDGTLVTIYEKQKEVTHEN